MSEPTHLFDDDERREEPLGVPLTIVSFCIPIVGAVLYFVHRTNHPKKAQTACYAALAGLVLGILIRIVTMATMGNDL